MKGIHRIVPHEGFEPPLRQESGFEPDASTSSANGAMVPVEQPKRIGNPSNDDRNRVGRYHSA